MLSDAYIIYAFPISSSSRIWISTFSTFSPIIPFIIRHYNGCIIPSFKPTDANGIKHLSFYISIYVMQRWKDKSWLSFKLIYWLVFISTYILKIFYAKIWFCKVANYLYLKYLSLTRINIQINIKRERICLF